MLSSENREVKKLREGFTSLGLGPNDVNILSWDWTRLNSSDNPASIFFQNLVWYQKKFKITLNLIFLFKEMILHTDI